MPSLRDVHPGKYKGASTGTKRNRNTIRRAQATSTAGHGRNRASQKVPASRRPRTRAKPRITRRKNGPVWPGILLWKLRRFRNKVFYIGYRLYPVFMFLTAFLIGMLVPVYIWGIVYPTNMNIIYISFLVVALLFIYYTYRWILWKRAVKLYYKRYYAQLRKNGRNRRPPLRRVVASSGKRRR